MSCRCTFLSSLLLAAAAVFLPACGGGAGEEARAPSAKSSPERTPMEELHAIPAELEKDLAGLTKPVDDVQAIVDEIPSLAKKHGLAAPKLASMAKATFDGGTLEVSLDADVSAEARADVAALLARIDATTKELKATPDKAAALATKLPALAAKVPVLATKVTTTASVTVSNPFADATAKAKAQADIAEVKRVQADVTRSIDAVQQKITQLPAQATGALAKLSASLAVP